MLNDLEKAAPKTAANNQITGNIPAPGGPDPMYGGTRSSVRDTLMKELTQANQTANQTANSLGIAPVQKKAFMEKGIKIGGKIVAQKDLEENLRLQKQFIDRYITEAGFKDKADAALAESVLNDRFNAMRLQLLTEASRFNLSLERNKAKREEQMRGASNWGALAGTIVGGIVGGYVTGGSPMGIAAGSQVGAGLGSAGAQQVSKS